LLCGAGHGKRIVKLQPSCVIYFNGSLVSG
jgi:hypothetical protein